MAGVRAKHDTKVPIASQSVGRTRSAFYHYLTTKQIPYTTSQILDPIDHPLEHLSHPHVGEVQSSSAVLVGRGPDVDGRSHHGGRGLLAPKQRDAAPHVQERGVVAMQIIHDLAVVKHTRSRDVKPSMQ